MRPGESSLNSHRTEAAVEDARFLLDNGCSMEEVARRVGLTVATLKTYLGQRFPQR